MHASEAMGEVSEAVHKIFIWMGHEYSYYDAERIQPWAVDETGSFRE